MPAIDSTEHQPLLSLEEQYPGECIAMMGLHPCSVKANYVEELNLIRQYYENRTFIAMGEIGLDFYWDISFKEQQYDAFHSFSSFHIGANSLLKIGHRRRLGF